MDLAALFSSTIDIWSAPASPVTGAKYVADENAAAAKLFAADPKAPADGDPTLRELYVLTPRWARFALDAAAAFTDDIGQLANPLSFYRDLVPAPHGIVMWQHSGLYKGFAWDVEHGTGKLSLVFLGNKDRQGFPLNLGLKVRFDAEDPQEFYATRPLSPDEQVRSHQLRAFAYVVFYLLKNPELARLVNSKARIAPKGARTRYVAQYPSLSHDWLSADGTAVVKSVTLAPSFSDGLTDDHERTGGGGSPRYAFAVRGHWRNQWYPSLGLHRPKFIHPFMKGLDTGRVVEEVKQL